MGQSISFTPDASASTNSSEEDWPYDNLPWSQLLENADGSQTEFTPLTFPWMPDFGNIDGDALKLQLEQQPPFTDLSQLDPAMDDGTLKLLEDGPLEHADVLSTGELQYRLGDQIGAAKQPARKRGRPRKQPELNNTEARDQVGNKPERSVPVCRDC
jgi:hypothetical protein